VSTISVGNAEMLESEYAEYRCSACKKEIKSVVLQCTTCVKFFFHPGCVFKHKTFKRDELVKCEGPFKEIVNGSVKTEMKKTPTGSGRERLGSTGSTGSVTTPGVTKQHGMDAKIDWLVRTVKEMRDEVACKNEIKTMITRIIREELKTFRRELEEVKKIIQEKDTGGTGSYSEAVKNKKKENIIIVQPKREQESEATKKMVKEKVDIKNLEIGITKMKKGSKGSIILGCESEKEMAKLRDTVREKLGEDCKIAEPRGSKPKLKVVKVGEEELLDDETLIDTIKKQNKIEEKLYIKIVKRLVRGSSDDDTRAGGGRKEDGSLILEVDVLTHELLLRREKINIGWRKCLVFEHYNIKRCFKCWGYYHIAKNCKREETCQKCAGKHKISDCKATKMRCVNCMHKIKAYNLKINDEHNALSRQCPTLIRALEEEKKRTDWESTK